MRFTRTVLKLLKRSLAPLLLLVSGPLLAPATTSAQTFAQPKVIPTGNWPVAIYTADVNADGFPDLIYIDQGATPTASTTHVLLNDGHGNFTQSAVLATAGDSVAIGDLTGNGHVDLGWLAQRIVSAISSEGLYVANGKGDGTFADPVNYNVLYGSGSPPFQLTHVLAGRMHDSGPLDISAQDPNHNLVYLYRLNPAQQTVSYLMVASLPDGTGPATFLDLNHDGHGDLIVNGLSGGSAQVFLGSGNGFTAPAPTPPIPTTRFTGTTGVHSLLIQDVNLDGRPDLIAEGANGRIDVFAGNGDGTFQTTSSGGTGTLDGTTGNGGHLIAVADLNHDGLLDALTVTPAGVSALLGQGTAYLGLKGIFNAGPTGGSGHPAYAVADFNHDGNLDLAVDSPEGIAILFGSPDGTFQTSRAFAAGAPAMSSALGAFTASGHLDAVVSTAATQAQLLLGQGDGSFLYQGSPAAAVPSSNQTGAAGLWSVVQAADLDSDGNLDLLLTADGPAGALPQTSSGAQIQLGDGTGHFASPQPLPFFASFGCSQSSSYLYGTSWLAQSLLGETLVVRDAYGADDIVNGNHHFPSGGRANNVVNGTQTCGPFAHNLGVAGVFTPRDAVTQPVPDLIVQGDGHLYLFPTYLLSVFLGRVSGDLSVDGSLTTPGQLTAPALSSAFNGPAVPTSSGGLGFPAFIGSMATADLDRDGNTDLLVTYANLSADRTAPTPSAPNYLYIWFGDGTGRFPVSAAHPVNPVRLQLSRNFYQAAVADLNHDGIPDLILSDGYIVDVQLGKGDGSFGPEIHLLAGQGINTISVADLNDDGLSDLVLANGGQVLTNPVANLEHLAANPDVNTGGVTVLLNQPSAPAALTPSSLSLLLCVDAPGSNFPCGNPLSTTPLLSTISFYFGQTLDGIVVESSNSLTGTINFLDGTRVFCTINASVQNISGNACPPTAGDFHAGNRIVSATYSGDSTYAPSTSNSIAVNVLPDITSATLTSSLNPAPAGQSVTFTVKVTGNFATPTGTVNFFDGLTPLGSATLDSTGQATFTTSTLAVGTHPITVAYAGTPDFNPATSAVLQQVIAAGPVAGSVTAAPEPSIAGAAFTLTARVMPPSASATVIPTGTILFSIDGIAIGSAPLVNSAATLPGPLSLAVGTHSLAAAYSGDANYLPAPAFTGSHTVVLSPTTTILIALGPTTIYFNQPADSDYFTTVANPAAHPPNGTITVQDNGVSVPYCVGLPYGSTCPYAAGGANRLSVGLHSLVVLYNGDSFNAPSASPPLVFTVLPDTTTATLVSSLNPAQAGSPVTFTAALAGNNATPTGSVNFMDGTTLLGTAALSSTGTAAFTTSTLAVGTHPITVVYAGNTDFNPVTSAILNQVINAPPGSFTLTVTPSPISVGVGRTGVLLVTVTTTSTFAQTVQLSCSSLPPESTCTFVQPLVPVGGGSSNLEITTSAPHDCGDPEHPYFLGANRLPPAASRAASVLFPSLLLLTLATLRSRRRLRGTSLTLLLLALACGTLSALSGCGRCTDLGTRPATYTFTVSAVAQSGPITETASQPIRITATIP